jgi:hypothetical protein
MSAVSWWLDGVGAIADSAGDSGFLQDRVCCEPNPICLAQTKQGSGFSARPAGVQMAATIAFCSCTERTAPSK